MITFCLINQKGGCGKSSNTYNLAGYFASIGLNALAVDLDPQGSLSQGFFGSTLVENLTINETIASLFTDEAVYANAESLITPTGFERISIICANQHLGPFNVPEPEQNGLLQYAISEFLNGINGFDVALIDCPPNLYQCSWNAMIASDHVVIPVPPEDFGTQGLRVVHQAVENARVLNPKLNLLGHIVTRVDQRLLVHRSYEEKLRTLYRDSVLSTVIPESSGFKVSLACRTPITQFSPRSKAAEAIARLGEEMYERASGQNKKRRRA